MFVLIWATFLLCVRVSNAETGTSQRCSGEYCITLSDTLTAEAGLCVVIPCSFTVGSGFTPKHIVWYKCEYARCDYVSEIIFHSNNNIRVRYGFEGRVSLLEPDVRQNNCSIIINDLKESDSGSYRIRVTGELDWREVGFASIQKTIVSVEALNQKPRVRIPTLTEGQQATLTCIAPGLCSGSVPDITWTWRGAGGTQSYITGNITSFRTKNLTAFTQRHISTLTFNSSAEHHNTNVNCKVSFTGENTAEESSTLKVNSARVKHCGSYSTVLPWIVAGVSLTLNAFCIIYIWFLWNARKKVNLHQEERTYMSLQKAHVSPDYDVIAHHID